MSDHNGSATGTDLEASRRCSSCGNWSEPPDLGPDPAVLCPVCAPLEAQPLAALRLRYR